MGQQLFFADSFSHYDNTGIPQKWDSAGGFLDTSVTRTGPQSLRISLGSSPQKLLTVAGYFVTGFAWRTSILAGETICTMTDSSSGDIQLKFIQNADGSISAFNTLNVLIAQSAAGVLTTGTFWYIEIAGNLNTGIDVTQLVITVTSSPGGIAAVAINATGFTTSQQSWNTFDFGGPAGPNHAWVADFYHQSIWNGAGSPLAVLGAPKIYGLNVPISDGLDHVAFNNIGKTEAFDGTAPPWFSQVDEIPQSTLAPIFETDTQGSTFVGFIACGQCFTFDVSSVPGGSTVAAVVLTQLFGAEGGDNGNNSFLGGLLHKTGDPSNHFYDDPGVALALAPGDTFAFHFLQICLPSNPISHAPWNVSDLSGAQAMQLGPFCGQGA